MHERATKRFVFFVVAVSIVATFAVALIAPGFDADSLHVAGFFGLIGILAQALAYQRPRGGSGNISFIPFLSAVGISPTLPVVLAVALSVLCAETLQRREPLKAAFNVAQYTLSIAVPVLVFHALGGVPITPGALGSPIPFVIACAAFVALNTSAIAGVLSASKGQNFWPVWLQVTNGALLYDILAIPVVYGFSLVYHYGEFWVLGLAFPLFGLRQLYKTNWELEKVNEELLQLMVAAIEARDPYTSGHSQRVSQYSQLVARAIGLSNKNTGRVTVAALLHDVGKIHEEFAPILRKPGRLTEDEFAIMRTHSEKGAILAARVTQFQDVVPAIRSHHEAWNGSGYPDGLVGEAIPQWARIIAFADTIDAMTTDRPYRQALDATMVRAELQKESGRQFDPQMTAILVSDRHWEVLAAAIEAHRTTRRFTPRATPQVTRQPATRHSVSA